MISSAQKINTEVIEPYSFVYVQKIQQKMLESRLLFRKIANFTGKSLQNYKQLEHGIFRILLEHVTNHLSVLFQFA